MLSHLLRTLIYESNSFYTTKMFCRLDKLLK